jgi:hypothetical protein
MKKYKRMEPPLVLVQTWVALLRSNESEEVRAVSKENLLRTFGSMADLALYMKEHNFK